MMPKCIYFKHFNGKYNLISKNNVSAKTTTQLCKTLQNIKYNETNCIFSTRIIHIRPCHREIKFTKKYNNSFFEIVFNFQVIENVCVAMVIFLGFS